MGLMDIIGSVAGSTGGGGGSKDLVTGIMELFAGSGGAKGVVDMLVKNGLGDVVESWVSTGKNKPIGVSDIKKALGDEKLEAIASRAGIPSDQVSGVLKDLLPDIIDKVSPKGIIEDD